MVFQYQMLEDMEPVMLGVLHAQKLIVTARHGKWSSVEHYVTSEVYQVVPCTRYGESLVYVGTNGGSVDAQDKSLALIIQFHKLI